ncbi:DUF6049 family protein [Nonomuraea recticatena]|uniref:DUF6049 family protein n=1 Tax=Nonomuraea recticatena TaxID=46178 RepID=A0ABP6ESK0_9ACTN
MIRKATLLSVLIAALLTPSVVTTASTAAAAPVNAQQAKLTIESITPDVPSGLTDEIKVSGKVTNAGTTPMGPVVIRLWLPRQPFADRAAMEAYLAGGPVAEYASLTSTITIPSLAAGGSAPFELVTTPAALTVRRFGVYPLGVEVLNNWQPVTKVRTFLTYAPPTTPPIPKTKVAFALPIIDQPHRSDDSIFIDETLRTSLLGNGRLADLLRIAQSKPKNATWFVDPALLDDVLAMTRAHEVRPKSGDKTHRPADASARQWLDQLRTALAGQKVVATPYADPDVAALAHQGIDGVTDKAVTIGGSTARELLKQDVPTSIAWPVAGKIDDDALDLLTVSKVSTVLLNADNLPPDPPVTTTPDAAATINSVSGPVTALLAEPGLSRTLELEPGVAGSSTLQKQRFVAESALIAAEPGVTTPRSLVVAPARRWNPNPTHVMNLLKTAQGLPWLTSVPLDSIKPGKAATPRSGLVYTDEDRKAELSKKYLDSVRRVVGKAQLTSSITTDHRPSDFDRAVLRLTSSAWRTKTGTGSREVKQVDQAVEDDLGLVTITDRTRALAGEEGQIPISVKNARKEAISLMVDVSPDNPDALKIVSDDKPQRLDIGPGQIRTIQVKMRSKASGDSTVTVRLRTLDGKAYDTPQKLRIRTTGYTGIALVITGAALSVMLAAVAMRILRRRSQRRLAKTAKVRENERV